MSDHEKTVQHAKPDGGNREEVHRGNHFLMVAQKGQPSFTWLGVPWRSFHPAGDRPFRNVEAEHLLLLTHLLVEDKAVSC
jgi:hypothetical protein